MTIYCMIFNKDFNCLQEDVVNSELDFLRGV